MYNSQMEMFQDGGLKDQGNTTDPVSGNDVPSGSLKEEVRDDIDAKLSPGEFVLFQLFLLLLLMCPLD